MARLTRSDRTRRDELALEAYHLIFELLDAQFDGLDGYDAGRIAAHASNAVARGLTQLWAVDDDAITASAKGGAA
jgi:hypothetical protein